MDVPEVVDDTLDGEQVAATVDIGGGDAVYVTPTRTLIYRADGLLSDETVEEYPHDADRLDTSEGRRKVTFQLSYIDGTRGFTVPKRSADDVLTPVLAGLLNAAGAIDPGEGVRQTYRFSESTLVLTDERVLKHIGTAVWDPEYDEYPFDSLAGLDYEEGENNTAVVLGIDGRQHRIKLPNDQARRIRHAIEEVVFAYHGVDSLEALNETVVPDEADDTDEEDVADDFGGFEPLVEEEPEPESEAGAETDAEPASDREESDDDRTATGRRVTAIGDAERTDEDPDSDPREASTEADDTATTGDDAVADRLEHLTTVVERQNELLERHQETIEQLIDELERGR